MKEKKKYNQRTYIRSRTKRLSLLKNSTVSRFSQKTNIQQLKEEIREKLPETTTEGNGGTSITGTNSTGTSTLRHRKNRPAPQPPQRPSSHNGAISAPEQLEIRAPSELLLGVPSTLKTQWRHQPKALVTGCVTYVANVSLIASVFHSLLLLFLFYFGILLSILHTLATSIVNRTVLYREPNVLNVDLHSGSIHSFYRLFILWDIYYVNVS